MSKPFGVEEEWVEICDATGKKSAMRFLATVQHDGKNYFILCAADPDESSDADENFMLIREECTVDGEYEYVIAVDEDEIGSVVDTYIAHALFEFLEENIHIADDSSPCGIRHHAGEFCACDIPELLQ